MACTWAWVGGHRARAVAVTESGRVAGVLPRWKAEPIAASGAAAVPAAAAPFMCGKLTSVAAKPDTASGQAVAEAGRRPQRCSPGSGSERIVRSPDVDHDQHVLQIVTGMYFREGVDVNRTLHRAVFYTNGTTLSSDPVELPVGRLLFATWPVSVGTVTIEAEEQLEAAGPDGQPEFHISTGGHELLDDLAAVAAFSLNVSFSRNQGLLDRLVSDTPGRVGHRRASNTLTRTFDPQVVLAEADIERARTFITRLLALDRTHFEAALRAVRRVVDATYLVGDDPTMAYTMFVAALESLSGYENWPDDHDWDRYDPTKAAIINAAVEKLTEKEAERVRDAVLEIDQLSLRRHFTAFVQNNIQPSFYRTEAVGAEFPIRSVDLPKALDFAYQLRSKNVHVLHTLAPELWAVVDRAETIASDGIRALGLQGLNRLSRHVISTFVDRAPARVDDTFDYREHLPGIVRMRLAPQLWIWHPDNMARGTAARIFDNFVSILVPSIAKRDGANMPDMGAVLERIEDLVRGQNNASARLPAVALYELWHYFLRPNHHRPEAEEFLSTHRRDLDAPTLPGFVVRVLVGHAIEWSAEDVLKLVEQRRTTLTRPRSTDQTRRRPDPRRRTEDLGYRPAHRSQPRRQARRTHARRPKDHGAGGSNPHKRTPGCQPARVRHANRRVGQRRPGSKARARRRRRSRHRHRRRQRSIRTRCRPQRP
jgi:hypothetical protein